MAEKAVKGTETNGYCLNQYSVKDEQIYSIS